MNSECEWPEASDVREEPSSPAPGVSAVISSDVISEVAALRIENRKLKSRLAHQATATAREQHSLQRLVIGMALRGYRFEPKVARSRVIKEIADDLRCEGVPLDEDTILKHLRKSAELLPLRDNE